MLKQVLVISEQPLSGQTIKYALRHARGCRVTTRVDGTMPSNATIAELRPDLILIDEMSSQRMTLVKIREARSAAPGARVVLLTRELEAQNLLEATEAGADAAIGRSMDALSFATLVSAVAAGQIYHAFTVVPRRALTRRDGLTPRELEILQMVAAGASNVCIAKALWVAEQTVKYHLSNIYRKLGVANRTQASYYAHVNGLLDHTAPDPARRAAAGPIAA
jgi:DNA-binding NarL/FixJ family response regulator